MYFIMNQTTWIVGGGLAILAIALFLYVFSGDGIPQSKPRATQDTPAVAQKSEQANPTPSMNTPTKTASQYTEATIHTNMGDIVVKLYGADSPKTVDNFAKLASDGFYNGTRFHRVIKNFMIQAGDPNSKDETKVDSWGMGDPGYKFEDEFNSHKLVRGSLAMANSGPNTNGSQFFIVTTSATPWLDGKHTNFGEVISGMDVVDKIEATKTGVNDRPLESMLISGIEIR